MNEMDQKEINPRGFLPDFCNIRITFAVVMAAELLAVILSVASFSSIERFWNDLGLLSLYIQWIALGSTTSLCVLRSKMKTLANGASGSLVMLVTTLVTLLVAHVSYWLVIAGQRDVLYQAFVMQSLVVSIIISLLSLHYFYMQFQLGVQQKAEADARFQALQARIRPHFLFNSMNTIAHLTRSDPEMAETVVENLADLFRAALVDADRISTLGHEIELAKGYLNIESMRLGDRLQVEWQIDVQTSDLERIAMPSLMLQPLLENSVYHGIEPSSEGGLIRMAVSLADGHAAKLIELEIVNTVQQAGQQSHRQGNRMAQQNTRQRLMAFYGDQAKFDVQDDGKLYKIRMSFPVE